LLCMTTGLDHFRLSFPLATLQGVKMNFFLHNLLHEYYLRVFWHHYEVRLAPGSFGGCWEGVQ
jgi:hypothetical protein